MKTAEIYIVRNTVNSKVYIGQTTRGHKDRFRQHKYVATSNTRPNTMCSKFYNAIRKYGKDKFYVEVLEKGVSIDIADKIETEYIKKYDSFNNGYNTVEFGNSRRGYKHSAETLKKMSESNKGRKVSQETINKRKETIRARDTRKIICLDDMKVYKNSYEISDKIGINASRIKTSANSLTSKVNKKIYVYKDIYDAHIKEQKRLKKEKEDKIINEAMMKIKPEIKNNTNVKIDKKLLAIALGYDKEIIEKESNVFRNRAENM